ncbi:dTDP-4-dehydrorhamnose 3,5-epimerase-like [Phymastichus coffea]|uniref:dTDP-4-dehydrorhamnose 3,5-epimerase-like n=1 Tax=Phymastichus coffea TaxID=108790 RepID=UPI00273CC770|nr:dTDP-4-dehydrorhamnose 3,5-epimerase-like [Phymastichus coffea]
MQYEALTIPDVVLITPKLFEDERGFFFESFRQNEFEKHCGCYHFVQDNHSASSQGVLRGLHYQLKYPQGKLVRVTKGTVFDVAVDLRVNSDTYGHWVGRTLDDQNKQMLWVPPGFAHGFYVISEYAEFQYKCTEYYVPDDQYAIAWNDEDIGIIWPLSGESPLILSEKDKNAKEWKMITHNNKY